MITLYFNSNM